MATLRDIKSRIKGVQSTQQITKAMKMVAAAKLRRAQENIINARPYANRISELLSHLVTDNDLLTNPYLIQREIKNAAVVVVTADRGLCGSFNTNLIKEAQTYIKEEFQDKNINYKIFCVGKKGFDFFSKRDYPVMDKYTGLFSTLAYEDGLRITRKLINSFLSGEIDKVVIVYNEFKSIIQQKITISEYLPIPVSGNDQQASLSEYYIFEPDQKGIFEYLLPKHLKAQMWRVLLESNAAELGARMTAMDNATTNASELIRTLRLKYNKERQAAITKEILEIVSGANALRAD